MVSDLSQFHALFFDECEELLGTLEAGLLGADPAKSDAERVNALFRAAHSIKGSSATFGFQDMMALAHAFESALDEQRQAAMLPAGLIDAGLYAVDVLRKQLADYRAGRSVDVVAARSAADRLQGVTHSGSAQRRWVRFHAATRALWDRRPIDSMVAELRDLGHCEIVSEPDGGCGPAPWLLCLENHCDEAGLREILSYAADESSIELLDHDPRALTFAPFARELVAEDGSYGLFVPAVEPVEVAPPPPLPAPSAERAEPVPPVIPAARDVGADADGGRPADSSMRVSVARMDELMDLVGELFITQSGLQDLAMDLPDNNPWSQGLKRLAHCSQALQGAARAMRMQPIARVFARLPRLVHDLSQSLNKDVELVLVGEQTELDRSMLDPIVDPLIHLVRNAIDHGIEPPAQRLAAGKPARGRVTVAASHQAGRVLVEVSDDGAGLDRKALLARARDCGIAMDDHACDADVWRLIFTPGLSTARAVTDVSGRGVGMDIVQYAVEALGGRIDIHAQAGQGTCFSIYLPLTLAIVEGMEVLVGGEIYILPLAYIVESSARQGLPCETLPGGERVLKWRDAYLPVLDLGHVFGLASGQAAQAPIVVVVSAAGRSAALLVQALLGQQHVAMKSIERNFRPLPGIAGASIRGDGRVALILDVPDLLTQVPDVGR